jgi:hypothetical protein
LIISHDGSPTPIRIALTGTGQARPQAVASLSPALLEGWIGNFTAVVNAANVSNVGTQIKTLDSRNGRYWRSRGSWPQRRYRPARRNGSGRDKRR